MPRGKAHQWSNDSSIVLLHFVSHTCPHLMIAALIDTKCDEQIPEATVKEKVLRFRQDEDLYDSASKKWKKDGVGKRLKTMVGDSDKFFELTYFGEDEQVVFDKVIHHEFLSNCNTLIFIGGSLTRTRGAR